MSLRRVGSRWAREEGRDAPSLNAASRSGVQTADLVAGVRNQLYLLFAANVLERPTRQAFGPLEAAE
jgi:hypothetical protein